MKRILLVDSEQTTRNSVRDRLQADGHQVIECDSESQVLEGVRQALDALIISRSPNGTTAIQLLREVQGVDADLPVIMACSSTDETLQALNDGALYVARSPINADEIAILVRRALNGEERVRRLSSPPNGELIRPVLVGETPDIRGIRNAVRRLSARPTTTVLILGESGAGKDTVARLLHSETNQGGLFVDLTGLASSESSLEVELFGSEANPLRPGLLERADGGTLFLGEITDVPLSVQTKLLRFVQERTFRRVGAQDDVVSQARVVATSSRNLDAAVRDGLLRPELAYRLAVVTLEIPPLR
ncbi:MAG TPA: sigma 54-interacting transcriptional regulator, partial [Polyangiaceae bacterium]